MNKSARSVFIFGLYLLALGLILLIAPNFLLGLFSLPATNEVWIRTTGMLVLILGVFYTLSGRRGLTDFIQWSVFIRVSVILFLTAFVLLGYSKPPLILFGVVDLLGAAWTFLTLRSESSPRT